MYKRNVGANNNQLLTIYQGVHITHLMSVYLNLTHALAHSATTAGFQVLLMLSKKVERQIW